MSGLSHSVIYSTTCNCIGISLAENDSVTLCKLLFHFALSRICKGTFQKSKQSVFVDQKTVSLFQKYKILAPFDKQFSQLEELTRWVGGKGGMYNLLIFR